MPSWLGSLGSLLGSLGAQTIRLEIWHAADVQQAGVQAHDQLVGRPMIFTAMLAVTYK